MLRSPSQRSTSSRGLTSASVDTITKSFVSRRNLVEVMGSYRKTISERLTLVSCRVYTWLTLVSSRVYRWIQCISDIFME